MKQQIARQGQKWSSGGWALQQLTLLSLALKTKKIQQNHPTARIPYCLMLVKRFRVTPPSHWPARCGSVSARNFHSFWQNKRFEYLW